MLKYKRILLKLSGEALAGEAGHGIDPGRLSDYIKQVNEITELGVEVGIVIGGGNIFRGMEGTEDEFDRVKGDYMGMLATVINGLALQSAFERSGKKATIVFFAAGLGIRRRVISVITAKVPSDPTIKRVRS